MGLHTHILPTLLIGAAAMAQAPVPPAVTPLDRLLATPAGAAHRIWHPQTQEQQDLWLRRRFSLAEKPIRARIVVSCDNEAGIFVNGQRVGFTDRWEDLLVIDLTDALRKGDNVIAVHAANKGSCAALALWTTWLFADGTAGELLSDPLWKVVPADAQAQGPQAQGRQAQRAQGQAVASWTGIKYDDKEWGVVFAEGTSPLGTTVYSTAPHAIVFRNRHADAAAAIEQALLALQAAPDDEAALAALDRVDRAVMDARRSIWQRIRQRANAKKGQD